MNDVVQTDHLNITTGVSGDDQMAEFQNATLQGHGNLEYSVATFVTLPQDVVTEEEAAEYLKDMMTVITEAIPSFSFEVQIGSEEEDYSEEDTFEDWDPDECDTEG